MDKNTIIGLDIGTHAVRIVMGQKTQDGQLQIIGAAETLSEGITRGSISSIEDTVSSVSETIEKCERMTGVRIEKMIVGINGTNLKTINSKGVVAVARANTQVDESDISRAIELAETTSSLPNYEVIHALPTAYHLDDQKNIKDPVGMSGVRLEVDTQVIMALTSHIKNLNKCIYRTGVDIEDIVFSILATSEAVLTKKQKESGVAVVNIGESTTSLAVFEEGDVLHTAVLPIGARHITNDLAIGLKTSIETAEAVKIDHAQALIDGISKRDEVDLNKYSDEEKKGSYVYKKDIAEITSARMEEIFKMVDDELKKIDRSGKLPSGLILTGGGAKLPMITDLAKEVFDLPVFIGIPKKDSFAIDKLNSTEYTTALGLVIWGNNYIIDNKNFLSNFSVVKETTEKMSNWFKKLLP